MTNALWGTLTFPQEIFVGDRFGQGQLPVKIIQKNLNLTENYSPPVRIQKNHRLCILEGNCSTNPILSALHLQGSKSNIYVHFH